MIIRHLDHGSMRPFADTTVIRHCLLVEDHQGLKQEDCATARGEQA